MGELMFSYGQRIEKPGRVGKTNRPVRRQIAQKFGNVAFNEIARTPIAVKRNEIPNPGHLRFLGVQLFRRRRMNRPI
jgi:hypothetical protein